MKTVSVCVYCGSRPGKHPIYQQHAEQLGTLLAQQNWRLVYGAGDVGLMGSVARSAQSAGADTFGVIPTHLMKWEVGKTDLTRFIVTENMHERKKVMFMNSDAIVVLPGGAGSLDELFEVLTWKQLKLHDKPILLLNSDGYWQPLLDLLNHVVDQGFADPSLLGFFTTVDTPEAAIATLRESLS
ncbi:hypothetical protein SAMN06265173_11355 [Thalassovita litoralis]|jgi:hypothetical protein|uniref:Cytokinin riboside 5'-monophosphate phosphoribohydrolase n=1 Tax=Thalassovita litoralis TaxID=1010611 RepID=A0A521E1S9_9RHOB|nr:TIGR00730 family Rossman fold protein [Thalassovita litoralis]SMO77070.1 hypothetical protein SAMN06265173_11355 [Thalassovita litoralis]